ncbi:dipeptide/oligopeptide/nickel ABC transporter ATP-binding protein [Streptomyces sp. Rer75]|uniref:ATP-binding cassette domain-containing protein n=1 Tax=Streptomyces sp. Rer75 TaxID=2750011 RepID=UPI0015D0381D|nr:dipeptide/oligopeptide/nickel ABC transporter ATP-binding protein [Streptomyces sp. Rer75]QLH26345.1 ABC transporter ATP-binding protein [Streptomyces sp. Rer75]
MSAPLLKVTDLVVRYGRHTAVDQVSFEIHAGETLALIGPSGCGKSSTALATLALRRPDSGSVRFEGQELTGLRERELRPLRPRFQPVFQDPYGSLSPRLRVRDAIAEPLRVQRRPPAPGRIEELMETVGLDVSLGDRLPHELSGGQCQRVGIARALAGEPRLLVLDEPVSALDPSVRAGVLNLLTALQDGRGLAYLFICHDLALVRHFAHRVAVMRQGRIVETRPARELSLTALDNGPA